jgi:hypothetical protein
MAIVTIGTANYSTYRTLAQTDAYLAADFGAGAYAALEEDPRKKAIITGTRTLDRMPWIGDKAESDQPNAWPRINTGIDGVIDDEVPEDILNAESEIAKFLAAGTDVLNQTAAPTVKRQAAGSVSIEYFRPIEDTARLPLAIQELIAKYLGGSTAISGALSFGTDACSDFDRSYSPNGPL